MYQQNLLPLILQEPEVVEGHNTLTGQHDESLTNIADPAGNITEIIICMSVFVHSSVYTGWFW